MSLLLFFSFINVIIYNVRDKSFRASVKELFLQCTSCRQLREISQEAMAKFHSNSNHETIENDLPMSALSTSKQTQETTKIGERKKHRNERLEKKNFIFI